MIISVDEYKALKGLADEMKAMQSRMNGLMEQLAWFQRQVFGQKSERVTDLPEEAPILSGFELPEPTDPKPEKATVPSHTRTKPTQKGKFKLEFAEALERIEVRIDPPESELILPDGRRLVRIDEERVEKLAHRASEYYVKVFVWKRRAESSGNRAD